LKDIHADGAYVRFSGSSWREKLLRSRPDNENCDHSDDVMYAHDKTPLSRHSGLTSNGALRRLLVRRSKNVIDPDQIPSNLEIERELRGKAPAPAQHGCPAIQIGQ